MRQDRDYWSRHVGAWRRSGLSKKAYSEQHKISYWSMRYWTDKLAEPDGAKSQRLVELEPVGDSTEQWRRTSADGIGGGRPVRAAAVAAPVVSHVIS